MERKNEGQSIIEQGSTEKFPWQSPELQVRPAKNAEHVDHESYMGSYHENGHAK